MVTSQISWLLQSWRALPKVFALPISLLSTSAFPLRFCGTPPSPAHKVLIQPEKFWRHQLGLRQHLLWFAPAVIVGSSCLEDYVVHGSRWWSEEIRLLFIHRWIFSGIDQVGALSVLKSGNPGMDLAWSKEFRAFCLPCSSRKGVISRDNNTPRALSRVNKAFACMHSSVLREAREASWRGQSWSSAGTVGSLPELLSTQLHLGIELVGIPRVAPDPLWCPRCPCSKLLRNTFSAVSLGCSCRAWEKRLWTSNPSDNKGHGHLWHIQVTGHSQTQREPET